MLCAKNLKVALAAIFGVVGLVSVGTAHAEINLNPPTGAGGLTANTPQYFAAEKLAAAAADASATARTATPVTAMATSMGYHLTAPAIPLGFLASEGNFFFRFDLLHGGVNNAAMAKFNTTAVAAGDAPAIMGANVVDPTRTRLQYVAGQSGVIYAVDPTTGTTNIDAGEASVAWHLNDDAIQLRVAQPTDQEVFHMRLSIWGSHESAARGIGNEGSQSPLWQGSAVIAATKATVGANVRNPKEVTASVLSNFRGFVGGSQTGVLADVNVVFVDMFPAVAPTTGDTRQHEILDHAGNAAGTSSSRVVIGDVLERVEVSVTGDNMQGSYNFGEFYVDSGCAGSDAMTRVVPDDTPATTSHAMRVQITEGLTRNISAGAFKFCANVAGNTGEQMCTVDGARVPCETYKRIEPVSYTMDLVIKYAGITAKRQVADDAAAGSIKRDGTVVRLGYLTTATDFGANAQGVWEGWQGGSYNQRLVIVNHGSVDAAYTLADFAAEDGVTVTALDAATGMVPAGRSMVIPIRNMITIEGRSRTSAKLTVVATEANVSVATTQVTLPEGQTDTVVYHPR